MMRRLFIVSTTLFWLAIGAFWVAATWLPEALDAQPQGPQSHVYTLAQVAAHATREDCWMAIRGQVYDLSAYLPQHPADPSVIQPWCGKDATHAYDTKTRGRPHSPYADQLLAKYRIGVLGK